MIRILAVCLSGALYPLCFPDFDLAWLAWLALLPLHLALNKVTPRHAFWLGWLAGLIAYAGTMSWVITAMHLYGQVPFTISILLMLLLAAYLGLYVALYTLGLTWLRRPQHPLIILLGAPSLWVALELVRTYAFSGLPWALFGYSQYQWLPIIQIADITGVYGVSYVIVLVNTAFALILQWAWYRRGDVGLYPFPGPATVMSLITFGLVFAYGSWSLSRYTSLHPQPETLTIGLVQANIDQAHKWNKAYRQDTLNRYASLTEKASRGTDFIIWPEAATPFLFEREPVYQENVKDLVRRTNVPLLLGSPALRFHQDGHPYLLNSAFLLNQKGNIQGRYDKRHLVPFGEYIPLHSFLFFLDKLVTGIGDFEPGTGSTTLTLPDRIHHPSLHFGVPICFEVIFPNLVRRMVNDGVDFMVTITNDAWFGTSAAPYQHFGMVVLRAVENRVAFARAANTGISGFIAPTGRILASTPIFTEQAVTGAIPLRTGSSFYSENGDVFAWLCVIIGSILIRPRLSPKQGATDDRRHSRKNASS